MIEFVEQIFDNIVRIDSFMVYFGLVRGDRQKFCACLHSLHISVCFGRKNFAFSQFIVNSCDEWTRVV